MYDSIDDLLKTQSQTFSDKLNGTSASKTFTGLRFPENIETDGTGNIIRFKIALPKGSRYFKSGKYKTLDKNGEPITTDYRKDGNIRGSIARRMSDNYYMTTTTIDLYMPPSIQSSYSTNWQSTELGIAGGAIDAGAALANSESFIDTAKKIGNYFTESFGESTVRTITGTIQGITPMNLKDAVEIFTTTSKNPYMEMLFRGVNNRTFTFDFKFIPRNEREQRTVKNIIQEFKFNQAPEFKYDHNNSYMLFPSEFDIQFIHKGQENNWLFKISTCALTNVTVNYSPENQYASHADGSPFSTSLTLTFTELPILSKEDHERGF